MTTVTQAQIDAATPNNPAERLRLMILKDQADTAEAVLAIQQQTFAGLPTANQERFIELFRMCLDTRKQSLTSTTTDAVLADVVRDALFMANTVWPDYRTQLETLR